MTDGFEEAVRQAAQGLGGSPAGETPTYHDAWQRGRRRRFRKQAGMAFAGALVLLAALTVNLGDFSNRNTVEISEIALEGDVATPDPVVPTTPPVVTPTTPPADSSGAVPIPPATTTASVTPTETPAAAAPAPEPTATAVPAPPPTTAPAPPATAVPSTPTVVPSPTPVPPTPIPTSGATTDAAQTPPTTTPEAGTAAQTGPTPPLEDRVPVETTTTPESQGLPAVLFIGPDQKPDAVVLDPATDGAGLLCDLDQDQVADAVCTLLPRYACDSDAQAKPGYLAIDLDEDGAFDTCVAVDITACDTTGDGFADVPCMIELLPADTESDEVAPGTPDE